jgi:hypothetical protein
MLLEPQTITTTLLHILYKSRGLYPRSIYVLKKRFDPFGLLETLMAQ